MRKYLFYTIIMFFAPSVNYLNAQCINSSITLKTQAEVDAFPVNYAGCDSFGTILITDPGGIVTDIVNLDSLIQLTFVNTLIIRENLISNLEGLDNLTTVDQFSILDNNRLKDFNNLTSLNEVRLLEVTRQDSIIDLSGFGNLTSARSVSIENNDLLESFTGLETCNINSQLVIIGNDKITNLNGIGASDSLSRLEIKNNLLLTDITQLSNLTAIVNDIEILNNPVLSNCDLENICDIILETNGDIDIQNNDSGCNSPSDLINSCLGANDYLFQTQDEIDDFKLVNGCQDTFGMLLIGDPFGTTTTNIKSLDSLECVSHLTKHLYITLNDSLESFDGLHNLKQIEKSFKVESNKRIKDFMPLSIVDSVGRYIKVIDNDSLLTTQGLENITTAFDIRITDNGQLKDVKGFESIEHLGNHLFIDSNDSLNLVMGFDSLRTIGRDLEVENCYEVNSFQTFGNLNYIGEDFYVYYTQNANFQGFEELDSIGGNFVLEECDSLVNMEGFNSLKKIGGTFEIYYLYYKFQDFSGIGNLEYVGEELYFEELYEITSFAGLENLRYIGGDFILDELYVLTDITALDSLEIIGGDDLEIVDCYDLSFCSVPAICNYISNSLGDIDIDDNNTGCATLAEVESECMSCPNCYTTSDNSWVDSPVDTDWHNPLNWSLGVVPQECHNVIIPTGNTVFINVANAACFTIYVEAGAFFQLDNGFELTIQCE